MGYNRGLPLVLLVGGVILAIRHVWFAAGVLIVMAAFGVWLMVMYDRR